MRRVVSLFLPSWSTDRIVRKLRQQPDRSAGIATPGTPAPALAPLVTALPDHGRRVVASVDAAARALGIRPGMTLTQARGFAPDLLVVDDDPEENFEGLKRLALWATRHYSPVAAPHPPDGIWIDITGCAERFGGEAALIKHLYRRVLASGLSAQIAVANTAGCAHAVARQVPSGRPTIIEPGKARTALPILPVHALRLGPGVADELRRMGFERIEQLMAAARAPLAKRFGLQIHKRLDQALGHLPEPIEPIFEPSVLRARRSLLANKISIDGPSPRRFMQAAFSSSSRCAPQTFKNATVRLTSSRPYVAHFPGCAMSVPMAALLVTNSAFPTTVRKTGRSRSLSGRTRPRATWSFRVGGPSNEPSQGWGRCCGLAKEWETTIASSTTWASIAFIRMFTRRTARYCYVIQNFESSCNCGCFPRTLVEVHTSGCRILKEGSSREALCRFGPVDGKQAGVCR